MNAQEVAVHMNHCNQGEYSGSCKYGEDQSCPAMGMSSRKECIAFLRRRGSKVAVQVGHEGPYVFVEKGDFIQQVLVNGAVRGPDLCDYDGNSEIAQIHDDVLHIPAGVN